MSEPIIEMPSLRTRLTKARDWIMTALWWLFWLYLIREIFYVGVDLLGSRSEPIRAALVEDISRTFSFYFEVIAINGLILIAWARYNRFRFRGKDRRSAKSSVSVAEIAETLSMSLFQVEAAQRARRMVVHHDEYGTIARVDVSAQDAITASAALMSRTGMRTRMSPAEESSRPRTRPSQMRDALSQARELFGRKRETTLSAPSSGEVTVGTSATKATTMTKLVPTAGEDATRVSRPGPAPEEDAGERTVISRPMPPKRDDDAPPQS